MLPLLCHFCFWFKELRFQNRPNYFPKQPQQTAIYLCGPEYNQMTEVYAENQLKEKKEKNLFYPLKMLQDVSIKWPVARLRHRLDHATDSLNFSVSLSVLLSALSIISAS